MISSVLIVLGSVASGVAVQIPSAQAQGQASAARAPAASPCSTPEHRQLDFWVGRWDVHRSDTNQLVAHSLIENLYNGCAIRENWMPLSGAGGGSLNSYRPAERRWRQIYTGGGNGWTEYAGGMQDDDLVLTQLAPEGTLNLVRMTYRRAPQSAVLQIGEQSTDGGRTWRLQYHLTYRPSSSGAGGNSAQ